MESGKWIVLIARIMGLCLSCMIFQVHMVRSQTTNRILRDSILMDGPHSPLSTVHSPIDYYFRNAHPIGTAKLDFPGPGGGYTLIHLPSKEDNGLGDTSLNDHTYLLDLNISHDGLFLAPDTALSFSQKTAFEFDLPDGHVIHADLTPGHTNEWLFVMDSTFHGTIGWGLIQKYITAFDFKRNRLTFYSLYADDSIADGDTNVMQLPLLDDEGITYCHCKNPSVWLDVKAPPLPEGHVNLAFHTPHSEIFKPSLDSATRIVIDRDHLQDSLAGIKRPIGLNLAGFYVRDLFGHVVNLAPRDSHRLVDPMPPIYHDFLIPVMGSLGTDVLRTFSGIIIDPSRGKLIFVK